MKTRFWQWTASLVAAVSCATLIGIWSAIGQSAADSETKNPGGYVPIPVTGGQPFKSIHGNELLRGDLAYVDFFIPSSATNLELTFRTYQTFVTTGTAGGADFTLARETPAITGTTYFYPTDGGTDLFIGADDDVAVTSGTNYRINFKMKSAAPLGHYSIFALGQSGTMTCGAAFNFILVDGTAVKASEPAKTP